MPVRFPLLLIKKRGKRSTVSRLGARLGEVFYNLVIIAAGAVGGWWVVTDALLPDLRLYRDVGRFVETTGRVIDARVITRPGLAEQEYSPELLVVFHTPAGERHTTWTRHGVGRDAPSELDAQRALKAFPIGTELPCWHDPADHDRVLLSPSRPWQPWLQLLIPLSLILVGVVGVVRALLKTRVSPEMRSAMRRRGVDVELLETGSPRPTLAAALPPVATASDSPGVRLAHRLPIDGERGWRLVGMAIICLLWNGLALLFIFQLAADFFSGERPVMVSLIVAPLAITGGWLAYSLLCDAWSPGAGGLTQIEVSRWPLRSGETCEALLIQKGQTRVRELTVALVCEEVATYHQGTDSRTATEEVYRKKLVAEGRFDVENEAGYERPFSFTPPADGPASFVSPHNEVRWLLEARVASRRWPEFKRRFELCVYPASWPVGAAEAQTNDALALTTQQETLV
ncbi:hypothetical protein Mal64_03880 [Pseudobythopirellula maris]|uniref:DUF3592 domain-containing protein n=1 Tax=Pseudobythopirellula maris TaxID=2527991 RepID=A0A5C5ZRY6_9BACT|nr:DUF3592 domain-containing protein [Pseudobythopirellula maris]TWT90006.1 hypothetical protein Mal64_03880 [Pseudobythopirellula maris]